MQWIQRIRCIVEGTERLCSEGSFWNMELTEEGDEAGGSELMERSIDSRTHWETTVARLDRDVIYHRISFLDGASGAPIRCQWRPYWYSIRYSVCK